MAAPFPASNLANLLSLPARHFASVDAGSQRTRILVASVARGRPRLVRTLVIDAHQEGFTTPEEMREEVRLQLQKAAPEAIVLVAPQHRVLRHVLDVEPVDAAQTRALVEREASNIGGLSESQWAFGSARLRPFGRLAHPLAAAFVRQDHLQELLEAWVEQETSIFDIRPAGDALAAAFQVAAPSERNAVLIDLGAQHTSVTVLAEGQAAFSSSFPSGSAAFTVALAADRDLTPLAAEELKRANPPSLTRDGTPQTHAALASWVAELERTLLEWRGDHPDLNAAAGTWTGYLAGGGALQPGLVEALTALGARAFVTWPASPDEPRLTPDMATAWGALVLALGLSGPAPTLLPAGLRRHWAQQRLWRGLLSTNLVLVALLALVLGTAAWRQKNLLANKAAWKAEASLALQQARDIRFFSDGLNARMDALRPVLEQQRQTVETLQVLTALQGRRTNAQHWYVLLADAASYNAGSNNFLPAPPPRPPEARFTPGALAVGTNPPPLARAFIAEVCLIPEGEAMRQTLSEMVGELKRFPLFRNVDVLPPERRRDLVATNLIFPERHFALELNLAENELLSPLPLPRQNPTNREPRGTTFRLPGRVAQPAGTNAGAPRNPRTR